MRRALILMLAWALAGCISVEPPPESRWAPGKASARGERVVFEGDGGKVLGKWRVRHASLKVYGADMAPVGVVRWRRAEGGELEVLGGPLGAPERALVTRAEGGRWSVASQLELELAEGGWLVYGQQRALLGALKKGEGGEWSLRRDLSGARVEGDAGAAAPGAPSGYRVAFALDGDTLDPVGRAALGVFLTEHDPASGGDG